MPELPEVEHLRRTLEPRLRGAKVVSVDLRRRDVVRDASGRRRGRILPEQLLVGAHIVQLMRHGKNLALISDCGGIVCVHLGMSGQLFVEAAVDSNNSRTRRDHTHCTWRLWHDHRDWLLRFRDPRRFGGLWLFPSTESFRERRLHQLGPDALSISATQLRDALSGTDRTVKCALLDQGVLAGVGNIYADEALFRAGLHPLSRARSLRLPEIDSLAAAIREVLASAVSAGGSSIRSYIDGNGNAGNFTSKHCVYGRGGKPCLRCGKPLVQATIAQRTTVYCTACQRRFR